MRLSSDYTYAIVGASNDKSKYGNTVLLDLKNFGFNVIPVNPKEEYIENMKCYESVKDINPRPKMVVTVVPPQVTNKVVMECKEAGIKRVWMQPGSESDTAIEFCSKNGIETNSGVCIMLAKNDM